MVIGTMAIGTDTAGICKSMADTAGKAMAIATDTG